MSYKLKNILYPTDFSECSANALPYAIDIASRIKGNLNLLSIYGQLILATDSPDDPSYTDTVDVMIKELKHTTKSNFDKLTEENDLSKINYTTIIKEGDPATEICETIKENHIHLTVMGTKGKSAEKNLFMGSVTKKVMQQSDCPVLAIPQTAKFTGISTIVYTTDLQYDESAIIKFLTAFAAIYNAKIIVLHVNHDDSPKQWSEELLKDIIKKSNYPAITYKEVGLKNIEQGINRFIENEKPDMLAMTTHTTNLYDKLFHKSLTKQMLFHTQIPLLAFNRNVYDVVFI